MGTQRLFSNLLLVRIIMLALLSAIFGFAAPMLPEVLKFFQRKQDYQQELEVMKLQAQLRQSEHAYKLEEIEASADIAEAVNLRQPQQSFGVQILDAANESKWGKWALVPSFYLFTILDFVSGMVRPVITYAAFVFYALVKWAQLEIAMKHLDFQQALTMVWNENDWAVLTLVLSYWFGHRAAKMAFGGSASNDQRN